MNILGIETSTDVCSVALSAHGAMAACLTTAAPRSHAAFLAPMIEQALRLGRLQPQDLDAVVVSAGPGSFTGLRIGAATAKGLCYAHGAALYAVSSLEAAAFGVLPFLGEGEVVCAAFPSRAAEVYAAFFRAEGGRLAGLGAAQAVPAEVVVFPEAWAAAPLRWLVGPGAERLASFAGAAPVRRPEPAPLSAWAVVQLAQAQAAPPEDLAAFEPDYIKEFTALKKRSVFERLPPMGGRAEKRRA